ncbi:MAG: phosphotransferase [Gemmatimonadota bacterium]|nr:MAG: phosphotransferase [Gemmatimonadota bacterium]
MREVERRIRALYEAYAGAPPVDVRPVAADGSARSYRRLVAADGTSLIGAFGPEPEENQAFLSYSHTFRALGLPVPAIYAEDLEAGIWLEEDLGDATLFDVLREAVREGAAEPTAFPASVAALYRSVLSMLPRFQVEGAEAIDFDVAYPRAAFDRQSIAWDLNYFKYHFLKLAHIAFNEARLERDFEALTGLLLKADADYFLYRDFQSRNVMVREDEPWFIDYQGGRRGALQYDVASLLYDAKADLPDALREELLTHYLRALATHTDVDEERFREHLTGFVLVRLMQALGAYGYRGFYERKPRFLQSVPFAARYLGELLEKELPLSLPEIESVFGRIVERWSLPESQLEHTPGLTVFVGSFRYAEGYPDDGTGHGGGFVFDCRSLPNPGREPEYFDRTGLDEDVVSFLEERPEVEAFWHRARELADAHVEEYRRRGFSALSVNFGCTGGQHRSVYFAERLARHLHEKYEGVEVRVTHREQADWPAGARRG